MGEGKEYQHQYKNLFAHWGMRTEDQKTQYPKLSLPENFDNLVCLVGYRGFFSRLLLKSETLILKLGKYD